MATALYEDCRTNVTEVYDVLKELNEYHHTVADEVAELYVNIVEEREGYVLQMLKDNPRLVILLIKVLDSYPRSKGKLHCSFFLKTLHYVTGP